MTQNLRIVPLLFSFSFDRPGLSGRIGSRVGSGATPFGGGGKPGPKGDGCSVPVFGARSGLSPARSKRRNRQRRGSWCRAGVFEARCCLAETFDHSPTPGVVVGRDYGARSGRARVRALLSRSMIEYRRNRRREGRHPAIVAREGQISIHSGPLDAAFGSRQIHNQLDGRRRLLVPWTG
jgi:hypothetical protein